MAGLESLDFKSGDPVRAADLRAIVDAIRDPGTVVRGGPGVHVRQGRRGQVQVSGDVPLRFVGVAAGDIPPRSGSAWGTGVVTMHGFDGSADYSLGVDYDVYNPSATTMTSGHGIDAGMYVWVEEDFQGHLIVTPLECS